MTIQKIVSLDGGGIRGLVSAVWLQALEKELASPLREHIDYIGGTSTGSIIASGIALGIPAEEIVRLFVDNGGRIFPGRLWRYWGRMKRIASDGPSAPKYDGTGLEEVLTEVFSENGRDRKFGELKTKTLITSYDVLNRQPVIFKSWREKYVDCDLWQVVKSSCSAPTYFPAHVMPLFGADLPLVDGGVVANNPAAVLLSSVFKDRRAEALRLGESGHKSDPSRIIIAAFGTGQCTRPITIDDSQEWGALEWARPVIDVMFDGSSDVNDYFCYQILPEGQYFRLQTKLDEAYDDLDNAHTTNLNALIAAANSYLHGPDRGIEKIIRLADVLKNGI